MKKHLENLKLLCIVLLVLAMHLSYSGKLYAQKSNVIIGKVTDTKNNSLSAINVVLKESTIGTFTDNEGNFKIEIPEKKSNPILVFSFLGFKDREETVGTRSVINVQMEETFSKLDEVVVVGYGSSSKRKLTSAISTVDAGKLENLPVANITQTLAGRATGLIVNTVGGGIGNNSSISIRGGGDPLYVIDDIVMDKRDFNNINPEDIESITVLKDASATAVYGAAAGNGILVVTTKRGKQGKLSINLNSSYNWSQPALMPKKMSSYEVASLMNEARINDGQPVAYTPDEIEKFRTGSDPYNYPNVDWQSLVLKDFATEQNHSLSIQGGSEKNKFYAGLAYFNQTPLYVFNTNNLKRYNYNMSLTTEFKEVGVKVITSINGYIEDQRSPWTQYSNGYWQTWGHVQNKKPMELAFNKFGQYYNVGDHPLVEIDPEAGYKKNRFSTTYGNLALEWGVFGVDGLKLKGQGNYRIYNDNYKGWQSTPYQYDMEGNKNTPNKPKLEKQNWTGYRYTLQGFIDYNKTLFEKHTLSATAGYEQSYASSNDMYLSRENYDLNVDQIGAGPVASAKNSGYEYEWAQAGFIGRVKYDYANKYFVEGSMRYDGNDNFPRDKRWGAFYAGSVAWTASEEGFMNYFKENHILDNFKVRLSYGQVGLNGGVDRFEYIPKYTLDDRAYVVNGEFVPGFSEGPLVSPDITWYTNTMSNIGFDFASFNNRLTGSFDYFYMKTTGYLASPSSAKYTDPLGISLPKVKSDGEHRRAGYEVGLKWTDKINEFSYTLGFNFTYFDQLWNNNPNEQEADVKNPYKRQTQAQGYWGIGYKSLGFYQSQEEIVNSPKRLGSTNLVPGDIKYADINGDGIIDAADQVRIGKDAFPRGNFGFTIDLNYKGWFANILFHGATRKDLYMGDVIRGQGQALVYPFQTDFWRPDNRNASFPRLTSSASFNGNNNYVTSDFWLINTAFVRLKTIQLGYDFKNTLLKNAKGLSTLRLTLSGYNLLTLSKAKKFGMDPEIGDANMYAYPISRVYSIGLNIGF